MVDLDESDPSRILRIRALPASLPRTTHRAPPAKRHLKGLQGCDDACLTMPARACASGEEVESDPAAAEDTALGGLGHLAPVRPHRRRRLCHVLAAAADRAVEDVECGIRRRRGPRIRLPELLR